MKCCPETSEETLKCVVLVNFASRIIGNGSKLSSPRASSLISCFCDFALPCCFCEVSCIGACFRPYCCQLRDPLTWARTCKAKSHYFAVADSCGPEIAKTAECSGVSCVAFLKATGGIGFFVARSGQNNSGVMTVSGVTGQYGFFRYPKWPKQRSDSISCGTPPGWKGQGLEISDLVY